MPQLIGHVTKCDLAIDQLTSAGFRQSNLHHLTQGCLVRTIELLVGAQQPKTLGNDIARSMVMSALKRTGSELLLLGCQCDTSW